MRNFGNQFAKAFWNRLFWYVVILHGVLLLLYLTAPTLEF